MFGELRKTGLTAFFLLGLFPFFGVILLGWNPAIILAGYFIDRIVYLLFCFIYDVILLARSSQSENKLKRLVQALFVFLVSAYLLIQFFGLIVSIAGLLDQPDTTQDLITLLIAIIILYSIPFIGGLKNINKLPQSPHSLNHYVGIVMISAALFMISFVGGVFLVPVLREHVLGYFFKNGYGIIIFLFVALRMITDIFFFSFNAKKSIVKN
jgi:hypothetical protein